MAHDGEGKALVTQQLQIGLSAVIGLTLLAGQVAPVILRFLRGGTCEIVGIGGTQVGTGFTNLIPSLTVSSGFQMTLSDPPIVLNTAGTIYFISSGATSVISVLRHLGADYS